MNLIKFVREKSLAFSSSLSSPQKKAFGIFVILIILLPAFVFASLNQTKVQQHASADNWSLVLDNLKKASGAGGLEEINSSLNTGNLAKDVNDLNGAINNCRFTKDCGSISNLEKATNNDLNNLINIPFSSVVQDTATANDNALRIHTGDGANIALKIENFQKVDITKFTNAMISFSNDLNLTNPSVDTINKDFSNLQSLASTALKDINSIISDVDKIMGKASLPGTTQSGSCPHAGDTKIFSSKDSDGVTRCKSSTGLGFNTEGGKYSCGPVACPGDKSGKYPYGNDCIFSQTKSDGKVHFYPGYTDGTYGGFNPHGCHSHGGAEVSPPPTLAFKIHVDGLLPGKEVAIHVNDNNNGNVYQTDVNGDISVTTWSGDEMTITPLVNAFYSISPEKYHLEVNTSWNCGVKNPCVFKAVPSSVTPTAKSTPTPILPYTPTPKLNPPTPTAMITPTPAPIQKSCVPSGCSYVSGDKYCVSSGQQTCVCDTKFSCSSQ